MAFKRITENDMLGKGNVGKPDTPGVSTSEMQRIMDELPREVIAPAFNELSGQLEANTASADIGANAPDGITPDPAPAENSPAKLQSVLQGIVNKITDHIADQVKHVTSEERTLWNNASNDRHTHDNKSILDGITSSLVGNWNAAFAHISDAVRHITENERTNWNDKYTKSETDKAINERVVEIGSSDMTKAVYDPETRNLPYIPKIDAEALTLGKNVVLSGTPVSIAYAGANRIASITAYGENAQGGTTEAPVALTGISSITVNDDVTELPIPRPLRKVGDVRDVCRTRVKSVYDKRIVLDGTENWNISSSKPNSFLTPVSERIVNGLSDSYPTLKSPEIGTKNGIYLNYTADIIVTDLACSTVEEFKAHLSAHPLTVYYRSTAYDGTNGLDVCLTEYQTGYIESYADESITTAWISSTGALSTGAEVAYVLSSPETYATEPLDFDNAAGPLTVMTGGELEVRMTELVGTRSPELTAKMDKAVYTQVGNPNLGTNTNFPNPINQRGAASYTGDSTSPYCIDRWRISNGTTYTVGTYTLSAANYANRACGMWQTNLLGEHWLSIGDNVTVSIYANGQLHTAVMQVLDRGSYSSFADVPAGYTCDDFEIVLCTYAGDNTMYNLGIYPKKPLTVNYIKWEKGSVATPYVPKDYGAELAECKRYFNAFAIEVMPAYFIDGNIHYLPAVLFPARMRVVPTIEIMSAGVDNVGVVAASAVTIHMDANGIREIIVNAGTSVYDMYNKLTLDMRLSADY